MLEVEQAQPDGITLNPWEHGKALTWNVTVVNTVKRIQVIDSVERSGPAAEDAERKKTEMCNVTHLGPQYFFYRVGLKYLKLRDQPQQIYSQQ